MSVLGKQMRTRERQTWNILMQLQRPSIVTFSFIRIWNTLADKLDWSVGSLKFFKSVVLNYYFTALEKMYDCEDPRTFKTICPRCNNSQSLIGPISCCYRIVIIQFFVGLQWLAMLLQIPSHLLLFSVLFSVLMYIFLWRS